jgi:hypothetical protein
MKLVNYVEYEHSYAHAIEPKLRALNYSANVKKMPTNYVRAIIKNALKDNDVYFTDKEQEFWDNIHAIQDAQQLYYYCKNCVNKAKETLLYINDDGTFYKAA